MNYLDIPVHVVVAGVMDDSAVDRSSPRTWFWQMAQLSEPAEVQELIRAKAPGDEVTLT